MVCSHNKTRYKCLSCNKGIICKHNKIKYKCNNCPYKERYKQNRLRKNAQNARVELKKLTKQLLSLKKEMDTILNIKLTESIEQPSPSPLGIEQFIPKVDYESLSDRSILYCNVFMGYQKKHGLKYRWIKMPVKMD